MIETITDFKSIIENIKTKSQEVVIDTNLWGLSCKDNEIIDSVVVDESQIVEYPLSNKLIGEYMVVAKYEGSSIYEETETSSAFTINPFTPITDDTPLTVNIGGELTLANTVFNSRGEEIHNGNIKYNINEEGEMVKFPEIKDIDVEPYSISTKLLQEAIKTAKASVAKTMEVPCLTGY